MQHPYLLLFRTAVVYISIGQRSILMEEIGLLFHRPHTDLSAGDAR